VTSPPENAKPKTKNFFFSISTRRLAESVKGLNSSLALAAGDFWLKKGRPIVAIKGLNYNGKPGKRFAAFTLIKSQG